MISASFKYRDFKTNKEWSNEMTDVLFLGKDEIVDILEELVFFTKFDRFRLIDVELPYIDKQKGLVDLEIQKKKQQIAKFKKDNMFFIFKRGEVYKEYKDMCTQLDSLRAESERLNFNASGLDEDKFYTDQELKEKLAGLLQSLSFEGKSKETNNGVTEEVLVSTVSDNELKKLATTMLNKMKEELKVKETKIHEKYAQKPLQVAENLKVENLQSQKIDDVMEK